MWAFSLLSSTGDHSKVLSLFSFFLDSNIPCHLFLLMMCVLSVIWPFTSLLYTPFFYMRSRFANISRLRFSEQMLYQIRDFLNATTPSPGSSRRKTTYGYTMQYNATSWYIMFPGYPHTLLFIWFVSHIPRLLLYFVSRSSWGLLSRLPDSLSDTWTQYSKHSYPDRSSLISAARTK